MPDIDSSKRIRPAMPRSFRAWTERENCEMCVDPPLLVEVPPPVPVPVPVLDALDPLLMPTVGGGKTGPVMPDVVRSMAGRDGRGMVGVPLPPDQGGIDWREEQNEPVSIGNVSGDVLVLREARSFWAIAYNFRAAEDRGFLRSTSWLCWCSRRLARAFLARKKIAANTTTAIIPPNMISMA